MWVVSVSLMTLWMMLALLGITLFGLTHLLCIGAIALEISRQPLRRQPRSA